MSDEQQQQQQDAGAGIGATGGTNPPAVPQTGKLGIPVVDGALRPVNFDQMWGLACTLAKSSFIPKDMIGKPHDVFVAVQIGMELGLPVMQAMQNIAVINGRPTVWGDAALALVEASGRLEDFEERFEGEGDHLTAVCSAHRRGRKTPHVSTFSVTDAKEAGLWGKAGPWKQYPKRMLQMRARGFCLRDSFPDVLKGVAIREEQQDVIDITPAATESPATELASKLTATPAAKVEGRVATDEPVDPRLELAAQVKEAVLDLEELEPGAGERAVKKLLGGVAIDSADVKTLRDAGILMKAELAAVKRRLAQPPKASPNGRKDSAATAGESAAPQGRLLP